MCIMDEKTFLLNKQKPWVKKRFARISKLGDTVNRIFERQIEPQQQNIMKLRDVWPKVVPVELGRYCRVATIRDRNLIIEVDGAAYRYKLDLSRGEILKEIRRLLPGVKVSKISYTVRGNNRI